MQDIKQFKIGFIGLGFVGGSLSNNLEKRGFKNLVKYSTDPQFAANKEKIKDCAFTFIAVPTPTVNGKIKTDILEEVLGLIGRGNAAIVRSTVTADELYRLQAKFDEINILHSPEFLDEATAQADTDNPQKTIVGIANEQDEISRQLAQVVLEILPKAPYSDIMAFRDSAAIKYIHNAFFVVKNVFFNMAFDMVARNGGNWPQVIDAILTDKRITPVHTNIYHKTGRGAGGHCLIKDFPIFKEMVGKTNKWDMTERTERDYDILSLIEKQNLDTLRMSGKDENIVAECYNEDLIIKK